MGSYGNRFRFLWILMEPNRCSFLFLEPYGALLSPAEPYSARVGPRWSSTATIIDFLGARWSPTKTLVDLSGTVWRRMELYAFWSEPDGALRNSCLFL